MAGARRNRGRLGHDHDVSIFRKPKGTYIRSTSEWFQPNTNYAQAFAGAGVATIFYGALFNNDPVGRTFRITQIRIGADIADNLLVAIGSGPGAGLQGLGQVINPLDPRLPFPSGAWYVDYDPNDIIAFEVYTNAPRTDLFLEAPGDGAIAIIPPTFALVLSNQKPAAKQVDFYVRYQVID